VVFKPIQGSHIHPAGTFCCPVEIYNFFNNCAWLDFPGMVRIIITPAGKIGPTEVGSLEVGS